MSTKSGEPQIASYVRVHAQGVPHFVQGYGLQILLLGVSCRDPIDSIVGDAGGQQVEGVNEISGRSVSVKIRSVINRRP